MTHFDERRSITIGTPMGNERMVKYKWDEGEPTENWSVTQSLAPAFREGERETTNTEAVGWFLKEYAIARALVERGYSMEEQIDDTTLLWVKYTE